MESSIKAKAKRVARHYGINQAIVAIEELSELQKELCKMERGLGTLDHLTEEIADVYVMLEQLKIIYEVDPEEIERQMNEKLDRQIFRIWAEESSDEISERIDKERHCHENMDSSGI